MTQNSSRRWRGPLGAGLLALLLLTSLAQSAAAHPLGNFTVNHYSRIEVAADQVRVRYVLDMAEIPTFQEVDKIDTDGNGQLSDTEQQTYLANKVEALKRGLSLAVNHQAVALQTVGPELSFPDGQGGLKIMRLTSWYVGTLPHGMDPKNVTLAYQDSNDLDRLGWREIVVKPMAGVTLASADVNTQEASNELRVYPQDMLASPLNQRAVDFAYTIAPGAPSGASQGFVAQTFGANDRTRDAFAALVSQGDLSLTVILTSLVLAFGLGSLHAMSPGHGKTLVGAYLVGSRGTAKHAVFLGATVTITHTIGVFALGLVTLFASRYVLPEQLYPWLSVISGVLVVGMGLTLFINRLRHAAVASPVSQPSSAVGGHMHSHGNGLMHSHAPGEALHSHIPPGPVSWRSLLALGISGGILPCPSALVVLLSAISLHRVGFGLVLIVAFSMGLAGVLTGIGLALVYAGRVVASRRWQGVLQNRALAFMPAASALVITVVGVAVTATALMQAGALRI